MLRIILSPLVRLRNKSILSTLKVEKVLKIRQSKSSMAHELVLLHGKTSN